jgi:hypothetical protein
MNGLAAVESHTTNPKRPEEVRQNVLFDVLSCNTLGSGALLDHLQNNLFHLSSDVWNSRMRMTVTSLV